MNPFSRGSIERTATALWYGDSLLALLLQPFACLYGALMAMRAGAYRAGLLRRHRVPAPVIVVGNVTVGGTGKTPIVGWLAAELSAKGFRPGIVSRGYGARRSSAPVMVTKDSRVDETGDEACMLARRTGVPVCVAADRAAAARRLLAKTDANLVIADDGLQHYALARDLEIAIVDGQRGLGNGRLLPAGPLREPVSRLTDVDFVLINGGSDPLTGDQATGFRFTLEPAEAISLDDTARCSLEKFEKTRVWSVAGIGNPLRFKTMLESYGIDPVVVDVPDHGTVSLSKLREMQDWPILMTEKDAIKYSGAPVEDAWCVPVDVRMPAEVKASIMKRIQSMFPDA